MLLFVCCWRFVRVLFSSIVDIGSCIFYMCIVGVLFLCSRSLSCVGVVVWLLFLLWHIVMIMYC